ncbi:MAG: hypothetical protein ACJAZN_000805 [Planctomycetota bacterium]|jgi:hypothetical protein
MATRSVNYLGAVAITITEPAGASRPSAAADTIKRASAASSFESTWPRAARAINASASAAGIRVIGA